MKSEAKFKHFLERRCIWKSRLQNCVNVVSASSCSYILLYLIPIYCRPVILWYCSVDVTARSFVLVWSMLYWLRCDWMHFLGKGEQVERQFWLLILNLFQHKYFNHHIQNVFIDNCLHFSSCSADQMCMSYNFVFRRMRIFLLQIKMICSYRELLPYWSGFSVILQSIYLTKNIFWTAFEVI